MRASLVLTALAVLGIAVAPASASAAVRLARVGSFSQPIYVTAPAGDTQSIYVVEQGGRIWRLQGGRRTQFADLSAETSGGGERGLLGLAFAADFAKSGVYFVYFTDRDSGDIRIQRRGGGGAKDLVRVPHGKYPNHNGGQLTMGPGGKLYAGIGDGGSGGDPDANGQNRGSLLGKIIRFDPANPKPSIYSYGLRNPFRFSFDRADPKRILIGDVGQDEVEEVDVATKPGQNFGWSVFEGTRRFKPGGAPGHVKPVVQRLHDRDGVCSIIGGYVVRDRSVKDLYGRYVYGDFCDSALRSARIRGNRASGDRATGVKVGQLSSFGEDGRGRVYVTSLDGTVSRLAGR